MSIMYTYSTMNIPRPGPERQRVSLTSVPAVYAAKYPKAGKIFVTFTRFILDGKCSKVIVAISEGLRLVLENSFDFEQEGSG